MDETTQPMTTEQVVAALDRGRQEVLGAVSALGERGEAAGLGPESRTAKDWLAVLVHHTGDVAGGIGADLAPPDYVRGVGERLELDEWHRRAIEYWRPVPLAQVLAEFGRVVEALSTAAGRLSDSEMAAEDRIPWAGRIPTWQIIGRATWLRAWPALVSALSSSAGPDEPATSGAGT